MKEFIEKLIGRLEERKTHFGTLVVVGKDDLVLNYNLGKMHSLEDAIEIVNQLAEEYNESETGFISRTKVLQFIEDIEYNKDIPKNYGTLLDIMRYIRKMPAISYNNGWIPCSERLPIIEEELGLHASDIGRRFLVCTVDGHVVECTFWKVANRFEYDDVIAWQPFPEPYRQKAGDTDD